MDNQQTVTDNSNQLTPAPKKQLSNVIIILIICGVVLVLGSFLFVNSLNNKQTNTQDASKRAKLDDKPKAAKPTQKEITTTGATIAPKSEPSIFTNALTGGLWDSYASFETGCRYDLKAVVPVTKQTIAPFVTLFAKIDSSKKTVYFTLVSNNPSNNTTFRIYDAETFTGLSSPAIYSIPVTQKLTRGEWHYSETYKYKLVNDQLTAIFPINDTDYLQGSLKNLGKCELHANDIQATVTDPAKNETFHNLNSYNLEWNIHYANKALLNTKMRTMIYVHTKDGQPIGAITYDGTANEGKNSYPWTYNSQLPIQTTGQYILTFTVMNADDSIRYAVTRTDEIILEKNR